MGEVDVREEEGAMGGRSNGGSAREAERGRNVNDTGAVAAVAASGK